MHDKCARRDAHPELSIPRCDRQSGNEQTNTCAEHFVISSVVKSFLEGQMHARFCDGLAGLVATRLG